MARYEITSARAGAQVVYMYEDAIKALRKVRTLQRSESLILITDAHGAPVSLTELEAAAGAAD